MVQSQTTSITPASHADTHRTGGSDPLTGAVGIDVAAHAATHIPGGADEVSILSTTTNVTGSRGSGSVYQNTNSYPIFVSVTAGGTDGNITAYTDSSTPPTTVVFYGNDTASVSTGVFFIVLPGDYYKVVSIPAIGGWFETH